MDMETGHDLESQGRRCGVEVEPERQGRGEDCALEEENSGTRYFPRFDVGDPTFVRFERYLCGIDGGSRSEKLARKMKNGCVKVSSLRLWAIWCQLGEATRQGPAGGLC